MCLIIVRRTKPPFIHIYSTMFHIKSILSWISAHKPSVWFFGILIVGFVFFSFLKHEPIFMDGDPFYHAKITQLMLEQKNTVKDFPWLPMSVFSDGYYDHHFLFHIFLLPFNAVIGDPLIAIRVATSFFSALFLAVMYLFFYKLTPRTALFPCILALLSSSLIFRLSLDKAPAISLVFLFCGLFATLKKKYVWLFVVSFLYVWLYSAWPLIFIAVAFYCFANALAKLFSSEHSLSLRTFPVKDFFSLCAQKENMLLLASCVGGLVAGIVINPYFPQNIIFYKTHLLSIAMVTGGVFFGIGNEWLPVDPISFINENTPFMIFWICAFCWTSLQIASRIRSVPIPSYLKTPSSLSAPSLFFMIFSLFLLFATIKSRRMGEYFIPIGSAFIAFTLQDFFRRASWREFLRSLYGLLRNSTTALQCIFCYMAGVFIVITLLQMSSFPYISLWDTVNTKNYPFHSLARVSDFISRTIPKGALIINDDWSYFPQLMYYADAYKFAWGLDPTFTHDAYPDFFSAVSKLGKEKDHTDISNILKNTLHSSYLLISKNTSAPKKRLATLAKKDTGLKKIYEDDEVFLYETVIPDQIRDPAKRIQTN